jgi:hypothetical protein
MSHMVDVDDDQLPMAAPERASIIIVSDFV